MKKLFKSIFLFCLCSLIFSCSSINNKDNKDELFIDDGSIQICTSNIVLEFHPELIKSIDDIYRYFPHDQEKKIFIKDLPNIWKNLKLISVSLNKLNGYEIGEYLKKYRIIILYEKSSFLGFRKRMHTSTINQLNLYEDGSFNLYVDDPESKSEIKIDYRRIINSDNFFIWAISSEPL